MNVGTESELFILVTISCKTLDIFELFFRCRNQTYSIFLKLKFGWNNSKTIKLKISARKKRKNNVLNFCKVRPKNFQLCFVRMVEVNRQMKFEKKNHRNSFQWSIKVDDVGLFTYIKLVCFSGRILYVYLFSP